MIPPEIPPSSDPAPASRAGADTPLPAYVKLRARRNSAIVVVSILLVLITFLFWYQTWFGRPLTDQEMTRYLADTSVPHKTQHALSQLSERLARGDVAARRWYPQLLALARSKEPQLRLLAAWAMGQDNHSEMFHQALRGLVDDPEPLVRENAALALVRFADSAGEPQLRAMLQPYTVVAPKAGAVKFRLKEQDAVSPGAILARISPGEDAKPVNVASPLAGEVAHLLAKDGANVSAGDALAVISPGETQVWESLRALYLVGQPQDLEDVDRYARGTPHMSERVRRQAETTAQAIRQRAAQGKG